MPAPLVYHDLVSQPVQTAQSPPRARPPTIPVSPAHAQELHPLPSTQSFPTAPPALAVRSPVFQPPSTAPSAKQVPHWQPTQPGQLPPTMSHFCRNLSRVSKETSDAFRAMSALRAPERRMFPPTTPPTPKAQSSSASTGLAWFPPAPTKGKLPYSWPSAIYAELAE